MKWLRHALPVALALSVGGFFVSLQREPLQAQGQRMQLPLPATWDYKVIAIGPGQPGQIDFGDMEAKLKAAGAAGWECVATPVRMQGGSSNGAYLVLKRAK
jgi:hypothetical protein